MPVTKQQPQVWARLAEADMVRLREMAAAHKKKQADLVREAVLFYMDHYDQAKRDEMEGVYAQQLKGSTNRICGLMAKTAIEVHAILEVLRRVDGGDEMVRDAMAVASRRLSKGLEKEEKKVKDQMAKVVTE